MKRKRIERHRGRNGNTITLSNGTARAVKVNVESVKCMIDENYNKPLKTEY